MKILKLKIKTKGLNLKKGCIYTNKTPEVKWTGKFLRKIKFKTRVSNSVHRPPVTVPRGSLNVIKDRVLSAEL